MDIRPRIKEFLLYWTDAGLYRKEREQIEAALEKKCREISGQSGVEIKVWDRFWNAKRTVFDERMVGFVRESANEGGFGNRDIQSGAGHDS